MLISQGDGNIDPITLMALSQGGDASSLLPFLLMSDSSAEDDDNSLLLFMLMNMQASS